jgi:hypothetical protein
MLCPKCKHATQVKDTRGTMRRRQCMNIACGDRFVTDEVLSDRPMPRTTAEANKLDTLEEIGRRSPTIKALRKQVAALEAALKAATAAPVAVEPAPVEPVAAKPEPVTEPAPVLRVPPPKKTPVTINGRPAAFFSRESLVADVPPTAEAPPVGAPSWVPRLPPAAFGRMR